MGKPKTAFQEHRLPPELAHLLKPYRLPNQEWFNQLLEEAQRYPECFDNPLMVPKNMPQLYELASRANVIEIAREMARCWGAECEDAPLLGLDSLRCWPAADRRGSYPLHLLAGTVHPTSEIKGIIKLGGRKTIEIRDSNNLLVCSDYPAYIRPGRWIKVLMQEYSHFLSWRRENEDKPDSVPKPLFPLNMA